MEINTQKIYAVKGEYSFSLDEIERLRAQLNTLDKRTYPDIFRAINMEIGNGDIATDPTAAITAVKPRGGKRRYTAKEFKERIVDLVERRGEITSTEVVNRVGGWSNRVKIAKYLKQLVNSGQLVAQKSKGGIATPPLLLLARIDQFQRWLWRTVKPRPRTYRGRS